jgi:chromosome segregation ATPase
MKSFLQALLIVLALALCVIIAVQGHQQSGRLKKIQQQQTVMDAQRDRIRDLERVIQGRDEELQRIERLKTRLTDADASNRMAVEQLTEKLGIALGENARTGKLLEEFKAALARANENIQSQNQTIRSQNEMTQKLAAERNEFVEKYNKLAEEFNALVVRWNAHQSALSVTNSAVKRLPGEL